MNVAGPVRPFDGEIERESLEARDAATASDAQDCVHCGLPLGPKHRAEDGPFCCHGCRTVYELIQSEGLGRYYDLRRCAISPPASLRPDTFNWLEPLLASAPVLGSTTVKRLRLDVQGVHCAACVWLLEQLFRRHPAGKQLRINPALGTVDLLWDTEAGELTEYLAEVEGFGYRFGPPRKEIRGRSRGLLVRMSIAIAAALNVMMFSLSYYFGLAPSDGAVYELFGRLNLILASITVGYCGWPFLRSAYASLRRRVAHLDTPIALGMVLAFIGSTWAYVVGGPEAAYFDTITIFVALMLVGRYLQERILDRNRNALLASAGVSDLYTRRLRDDRFEAVSASEVREGDTLWIAAGDLVPVDGILVRSDATISLDWITGEAEAISCQPGADVPAGAFNAGDTGFRLVAREEFSASRLNDLIAASDSDLADVQEVRDRLAGGWWHRVATVYVAAVLGLASLGFVFWIGAGLQRAVEVSVAILVVTCPCALGIGVPLGRELTHAALRRVGVLLRNDSFLDRALHVRQIVFDKTGTLTRGQLRLSDRSRRALLGLPPELRDILGNMCVRSSHPVSRAVAGALGLAAVAPNGERSHAFEALDDADEVREVVGQGLEWERDGVVHRFGRPDFALSDESDDGDPLSSRVVFSRDGVCLLSLELDEDLRPDVREEVVALEAHGYAVHLLSGDRSEKVDAVAEAVGIAYALGDLTPEQKAQAVRELDRGDTLMVGDGLNDSLSFDAALCSATPAVDRAILPQKADFYFLGDGVAAVRRSLLAARRLRRVQLHNLIGAAVYNLGAVALCLGGWVSPVVAAILMPLSSLAVVTHTVSRLGSKEDRWMS